MNCKDLIRQKMQEGVKFKKALLDYIDRMCKCPDQCPIQPHQEVLILRNGKSNSKR